MLKRDRSSVDAKVMPQSWEVAILIFFDRISWLGEAVRMTGNDAVEEKTAAESEGCSPLRQQKKQLAEFTMARIG